MTKKGYTLSPRSTEPSWNHALDTGQQPAQWRGICTESTRLETNMSPTINPKEPKERPFPWPCADCYTLTVVLTLMDYTARVKHDGVVYELHLPSLEIPRCQTCGETVITNTIDEQINEALRARLHLLT